ncbi:MAG: type I-E CRISPR-associated protein Cse2/CasB [Dehalococcoidia bacterium]|nr:type I-E CRISPR-associated protein Cse2/CasB [Dehalococcoidia bacterium]
MSSMSAPAEYASRDDLSRGFAGLLRRLVELAPDDARGHRGDRGAMSALRRGLGAPDGYSAERSRVVAPFVPANARDADEAAMYMVASLFALHPHHTLVNEDMPRSRGLGATLARIRIRADGDEDKGVERRFILALDSDAEHLPERLRHLVTLLDARLPGAPVDYFALFQDILDWHAADHRVQRRWARGFYARNTDTSETDEQPGETTNDDPDN